MKALTAVSYITYVSLIVGFIVGFLGQRSRMCFIGGWRDFFLIRDKYLLKGFLAFLISAAVFFFVFHTAGNYLGKYPWFNRPPDMFEVFEFMPDERFELPKQRQMESCELFMTPLIILGEDIPFPGVNVFGVLIPNEILLALGAAFFLGLFSTLANGCPFRQHVMAGSGNVTAIFYLVGFYIAVLVYDTYMAGFMNTLVNAYK